jgi:flagellar basal-body rod protein FlgF
MIVSEGGQLMIEPLNGEPGVTENLGLIGLISAQDIQLKKDDDGEIRPEDVEIQPDQNVKIKQGYVEESNVNAIDELVASMGYQRSYELNMKLIKTASDLDENTASLLRLPNG